MVEWKSSAQLKLGPHLHKPRALGLCVGSAILEANTCADVKQPAKTDGKLCSNERSASYEGNLWHYIKFMR